MIGKLFGKTQPDRDVPSTATSSGTGERGSILFVLNDKAANPKPWEPTSGWSVLYNEIPTPDKSTGFSQSTRKKHEKVKESVRLLSAQCSEPYEFPSVAVKEAEEARARTHMALSGETSYRRNDEPLEPGWPKWVNEAALKTALQGAENEPFWQSLGLGIDTLNTGEETHSCATQKDATPAADGSNTDMAWFTSNDLMQKRFAVGLQVANVQGAFESYTRERKISDAADYIVAYSGLPSDTRWALGEAWEQKKLTCSSNMPTLSAAAGEQHIAETHETSTRTMYKMPANIQRALQQIVTGCYTSRRPGRCEGDADLDSRKYFLPKKESTDLFGVVGAGLMAVDNRNFMANY